MTDDDDLERYFAAARDHRPAPSDAMLARVVADAASVQAARATAPAPRRRAWFRTGLGAFFGTGGALAGLATASAAGFWIGAVQPDLVLSVWQQEAASVELIPSLDGLLADAGE